MIDETGDHLIQATIVDELMSAVACKCTHLKLMAVTGTCLELMVADTLHLQMIVFADTRLKVKVMADTYLERVMEVGF
jgi:hypothetical protein